MSDSHKLIIQVDHDALTVPDSFTQTIVKISYTPVIMGQKIANIVRRFLRHPVIADGIAIVVEVLRDEQKLLAAPK